MYIPKYFAIHELIGPNLYNQYNGASSLWLALDERMLRTLDLLRSKYGRMIVNNWRSGGPRKESGLREMGTSTGAALSQHKFGRAADVLFMETESVTPESVRKEMKALGVFDSDMRESENPDVAPFRFINRVEWYANGSAITWFHFDVGNDRAVSGGIRIVNA